MAIRLRLTTLFIVGAMHLSMPWTHLTHGADGAANLDVRLSGERQALENTVDERFVTQLPLLILEFPDDGMGSIESGKAVLSVHNGAAMENKVDQAPDIIASVMAQSVDDTTAKPTYHIQLHDQPGQRLSLAGLPANSRWILHGTAFDKGMLRNGLAYALGRELFKDAAPQTRFCELLVKKGDSYRYDGVYILAENDESSHASDTAGDSFLLEYSPRTDRLAENTVRVGSTIFADKTVWNTDDRTEARRQIVIGLTKLENTLQSVRPEAFLSYESMLDQRTVIDTYILNSLLMNALETKAPFRIQKRAGEGALQFLPVWNFDFALDNSPRRDYPLPFEENLPETELPSLLSRRLPVWRTLEAGGDIRDLRVYPAYVALDGESYYLFNRLFMSRSFLTGLYERYHQLRRTALSPENVQKAVDEMAAFLGPALARDWNRWRDTYAATEGALALTPFVDDKGMEHIRRTGSYDQELVKIRRNLREQDGFLMKQMEQLPWMSVDLYDRGTAGNRQAAYSIVTIVGLMVLMYLLSKKI